MVGVAICGSRDLHEQSQKGKMGLRGDRNDTRDIIVKLKAGI